MDIYDYLNLISIPRGEWTDDTAETAIAIVEPVRINYTDFNEEETNNLYFKEVTL